ncbi:MAG: translation factor Sua5, partial [Flavobacteriales bacterium]|nr:translation factor Sua5 [Flavobacteriales bacterium]
MSFHDEVQECIKVLKAGGIILYPTDTVWGLGCDAGSEKAVQKLYELKGRQLTKSMIVLVDNDAKLERYFGDVPEVAW